MYACDPMTSRELMEAFPGCACDFDQLPVAIVPAGSPDTPLEVVIAAATDAVWLAANGTVGRCTTTVRPVRTDEACWPTRSLFAVSDKWSELDGIPLRGPDPVVNAVKINGAVVPAADYIILDGYKLVRRSGYWPGTQDVRLADTETGTFSVQYSFGSLPLLAQMAATEIACFLSRWIVDKIEALPNGVTGTIMDGVSLFINPATTDQAHTPWLSQFLSVFGDGIGAVWSVELDEGWTLHSVA